MKSKKNRKNKYSKLDPATKVISTVELEEPKMINRKEVQADIDLVKKVKNLLSKNAYNDNQIAAMLGIHAQKVKQIKDGS